MPKKKKKDKVSGSSDPTADAPVEIRQQGLSSDPLKLSMSLNKSSGPGSALVTIKPPSKLLKEGDPNLALIGNDEIGEMEQALEAHGKDDTGMQGVGGGLNVFAINKDGISRAVMKFREAPKPMPLTICFHFPGTFLTHRYVTAIVKGTVQSIEGATVKGVQYVDRNVRLGTRGLENRWLVTVNNPKAKDLMVRQGIKIVNRTINVRSYDDVLREEYQEYVRYADLKNRMKMGFGANKIKKPGATDSPPVGGGAAAAAAAAAATGGSGVVAATAPATTAGAGAATSNPEEKPGEESSDGSGDGDDSDDAA